MTITFSREFKRVARSFPRLFSILTSIGVAHESALGTFIVNVLPYDWTRNQAVSLMSMNESDPSSMYSIMLRSIVWCPCCHRVGTLLSKRESVCFFFIPWGGGGRLSLTQFPSSCLHTHTHAVSDKTSDEAQVSRILSQIDDGRTNFGVSMTCVDILSWDHDECDDGFGEKRKKTEQDEETIPRMFCGRKRAERSSVCVRTRVFFEDIIGRVAVINGRAYMRCSNMRCGMLFAVASLRTPHMCGPSGLYCPRYVCVCVCWSRGYVGWLMFFFLFGRRDRCALVAHLHPDHPLISNDTSTHKNLQDWVTKDASHDENNEDEDVREIKRRIRTKSRARAKAAMKARADPQPVAKNKKRPRSWSSKMDREDRVFLMQNQHVVRAMNRNSATSSSAHTRRVKPRKDPVPEEKDEEDEDVPTDYYKKLAREMRRKKLEKKKAREHQSRKKLAKLLNSRS